MITQHIMHKPIRATAFFVLFIFFGCGRAGNSGHRGAAARAGSGGGASSATVSDPASGESAPAAGSDDASAVGPRAVAYDVYVDNSASMDGYLSGAGTDFKNDVHTFLKDLQTQGIADTIDLGYVNDRICTFRENASASEVNAFIRSLNHDSLMRNGCGRKDSYMDAMLQRVIGTNPDHVHVLISDYIFSIGRGNSSELLKQQGDNVETVLSAELRRRDFSTIILKFSSGFDGTYYVESRGGGNGSAVDVRGIRRPYYMMIFGAGPKIRRLVEFFKNSKFKTYGGFEQVCYFMGAGPGGGNAGNAPAAKLIRKDRVGDFEIAQPATRLVIDKAVADSVDFQFAVAVNLDELKLDEKYLTNPANYELPANYRIASIRRNDDPTDEALRGFSHVFLIRTTDLKPVQDVYVRLKTVIPGWVYLGSTLDDSRPTDSAQQRQTFGFSYLVEGLSRGYLDRYKNGDLFALNIQVSEGGNVAPGSGDNGGGTGGQGVIWLGGGFGGVIGLVVWIKNKR